MKGDTSRFVHRHKGNIARGGVYGVLVLLTSSIVPMLDAWHNEAKNERAIMEVESHIQERVDAITTRLDKESDYRRSRNAKVDAEIEELKKTKKDK